MTGLLALSACGRSSEDWLADLASSEPLTRRIAAAALSGAAPSQRVVDGLLAAGKHADPELDALALQALMDQPGAVATAARMRREQDSRFSSWRLANVILAGPEPAAAAAVAELLIDPLVSERVVLAATCLGHARDGRAAKGPAGAHAAPRLLGWLAGGAADQFPADAAGTLAATDAGLATCLAQVAMADAEARARLLAAATALPSGSVRSAWFAFLVDGCLSATWAGTLTDEEVLPLLQQHAVDFAPALTARLRDPTHGGRVALALTACGEAARPAIPQLEALAADGDSAAVRRAAQQALALIKASVGANR